MVEYSTHALYVDAQFLSAIGAVNKLIETETESTSAL